MKKTTVYDFPTRVFHWLFALLFVVAFAIGSNVDDESTLFSYHSMAGILLFLLVVLRICWGFIGSKYSRFAEFPLRASELLAYFKGVLTGDKRKWAGHNPASSWAALLMMAIAISLGVTGFLMATHRGGKSVEEIHEILANAFLVIVILHLAGLALHTLRHRDAIWSSMISGSKVDVPEEREPIAQSKIMGAVLLFFTLGLAVYFVQKFDSASRTLTLFGTQLQIGEREDEAHERKSRKKSPERKSKPKEIH